MKELHDLIDWHFTVGRSGHTVRYGLFNRAYYKQFQPRGISIPKIHPARPITKHLYDMAKRLAMTAGTYNAHTSES